MEAASDASAPLVGDLPLAVNVDAVVPYEVFCLRYAMAVLDAHNGNMTRAGKALGLTRHQVARLAKRAAELGMI